jgi:hypothetical protein
MAVYIVHRIPVKLSTLCRRTLATRGRGSVVALAVVKMMIYVPVEMIRAVIPGACTDKNPAREPFRAIVAIRGAIIRGLLIITVGTNRGFPDTYRNLCRRPISGSQQKPRCCER